MEWDLGIFLTRWFLVTGLEFENFSFKHLKTQPSYLTPNLRTRVHAKAYNYSKVLCWTFGQADQLQSDWVIPTGLNN